ncbi:DinB family protein [Paenibacillus profundus]|nr:DinB family protein [Paenibacillus profundus]
MMAQENTFRLFHVISVCRMVNHYLPKVKISLEQLKHEEIWKQDSENAASIGGIVLHIMEHVKRNTLRLIEVNATFEQGIEDYFPYPHLDKQRMLQQLDNAFAEWKHAMDTTAQEKIDMYNVYHLVEHTGYHVGQIFDRAQRMTGCRFQFVQNGINEKALRESVEEEMRNTT